MEDHDARIDLQRGMWLLIPPFVKVKHHHVNLRRVSIHFSYSLLHGMEILSCTNSIHSAMAPELLQTAETISPENIDPMQLANNAQLLIRTALNNILPMPEFAVIHSRSANLLAYDRLTKWLSQRLDPNIKIAEMARIMNCGEQTFAKKFVADIGITPRKFNENIIIDQAVELLEHSDLSVKEIAGKLHFSNEYYFSRFFKRSMNFPPGTFRRKMRQQQ